MPSASDARMDLRGYDVSWKGTSIGYVADADFAGFKLKKVEKKIAVFGDIVVDRLLIGAEGSIKTTLQEVNKLNIQQLSPHWSSGSVPISTLR